MEEKILTIINEIRKAKNLSELSVIDLNDTLRDDIGSISLDLAESTVRIEDEFDIDIFEDGLVNTVDEIIERLR